MLQMALINPRISTLYPSSLFKPPNIQAKPNYINLISWPKPKPGGESRSYGGKGGLLSIGWSYISRAHSNSSRRHYKINEPIVTPISTSVSILIKEIAVIPDNSFGSTCLVEEADYACPHPQIWSLSVGSVGILQNLQPSEPWNWQSKFTSLLSSSSLTSNLLLLLASLLLFTLSIFIISWCACFWFVWRNHFMVKGPLRCSDYSFK